MLPVAPLEPALEPVPVLLDLYVGASDGVGAYPPPADFCEVPFPPTGPVDKLPLFALGGTGTLKFVLGVVVTFGAAGGVVLGLTLGGAGFGAVVVLAGCGEAFGVEAAFGVGFGVTCFGGVCFAGVF